MYLQQILNRFLVNMKSTLLYITKTCLFKYIGNFISKNRKFSDKKKNSDVFYISAQNIDCGYSLEPPRHFYRLSVATFYDYIDTIY